MKRTRKHMCSIGSLMGSAALWCALSASAHAQSQAEQAESDQPGEAITLPATPDWGQPFGPAPRPGTHIRTVTDKDGACRHAPLGGLSSAEPLGCPFDDTKFGLSVQWRGDGPAGEFSVRAAVGRQSEDGLGLDRQFLSRTSGTSLQSTLTEIGVDATLLDGRLSVASEFGWSRRWRTGISGSSLLPERFDRTGGNAQSHSIDFKVADSKAFALSLEGEYTKASGYYLPFSIDKPSTLFALPGEQLEFGSKARVGDVQLKAQVSSMTGDLFDRNKVSGSLSYSGISLRAKAFKTRSKPFVFEGFAQALVGENRAVSSAWLIGVEFTPSVLFPVAASSSDGWGALLPQSLGIDIGRRKRLNDRGGVIERSGGPTFAANGVWMTPLGLTIVSYDRQTRRGLTVDDPGLRYSDSSMMIDHSFSIGKWSLGASILRTSNSNGNMSSGGSGSNVTYYGVSATRTFKDGPRIRIELGRDAMAFDIGQGDFRLRDRTTRLEASIDLSDMLQKRFKRPDLHLQLEGRLDLSGSGYEFRLLDDVLESEFDRLNAQGALLTFGMDLR